MDKALGSQNPREWPWVLNKRLIKGAVVVDLFQYHHTINFYTFVIFYYKYPDQI